MGHMVVGSKVRIKPEHLVYSIIGRPRIIYKIIKIFQFIVIIILYLFLYCMEFSINFQYRLLNGIPDLPCSTFK